MICETGSIEDPYTWGRKGQWMLNAGDSIKSDVPGLRALTYSDFDVTKT